MSIAPFEGAEPARNFGELAPEAYAPSVELDAAGTEQSFRIIDSKTGFAEVSARRRLENACNAVGDAYLQLTGESTRASLGAVDVGDAVTLTPLPTTSLLERPVSGAEHETAQPKFGIRPATHGDIEAMATIDARSFSKVYEDYGKTEAQQHAELTTMFSKRYDMVGGKWMPVVTQKNEAGEDEVVGFMHCSPTSKDPTTFVSWEETTSNGTLENLYDPDGKNVYIVTLSMDPKVKGQRGQNSLFMQQIGTFIKEGMDTAFFESRMPGLRDWVEHRCQIEERAIEALNETEKLALAQEYFGLTRERRGKQVPLDPLLKVYAGAGCKLQQLVPNAYKDGPSMDFGVLCTFDNPLKGWARKSPIVRNAIGGAMKLAAKSSWLTRKLFG